MLLLLLGKKLKHYLPFVTLNVTMNVTWLLSWWLVVLLLEVPGKHSSVGELEQQQQRHHLRAQVSFHLWTMKRAPANKRNSYNNIQQPVSSDQALCQWNYIKSGIVVSGNHIKSVVDQSFYNSEHNNATSYVQHSRPALTSNIYITHLRLEISIKPPAFVFFWCVLFSNLQLC